MERLRASITFRSISSLCHRWIATTHLSYSFLSLKLPPPPCAVLLVYIMHLFVYWSPDGIRWFGWIIITPFCPEPGPPCCPGEPSASLFPFLHSFALLPEKTNVRWLVRTTQPTVTMGYPPFSIGHSTIKGHFPKNLWGYAFPSKITCGPITPLDKWSSVLDADPFGFMKWMTSRVMRNKAQFWDTVSGLSTFIPLKYWVTNYLL